MRTPASPSTTSSLDDNQVRPLSVAAAWIPQIGPQPNATETNASVDKLLRIQQLWQEIGRMKTSDPEYEMLLNSE